MIRIRILSHFPETLMRGFNDLCRHSKRIQIDRKIDPHFIAVNITAMSGAGSAVFRNRKLAAYSVFFNVLIEQSGFLSE